MAKVLITREPSAAKQSTKTLERAGHTPLLWPIFKVTDTGATLPAKPYDGIIFTSNNAIKTLEARGWKPPHKNMKAWCVGKRTAEAAKQLGLEPIISKSGNAQELTKELGKLTEPCNILYPTTPDRGFDIKAALEGSNIILEVLEIYQVLSLEFDVETVQKNLINTNPDIVFIYSHRSAQHLLNLIKSANISQNMKSIELVAISENAAAPLEGIEWKTLKIANCPEESAMIDLIS